MLDLECRQCGYKFKTANRPSRCPYCSAQGTVGLVKSAQDLLDETIGESRDIDEERKKRS